MRLDDETTVGERIAYYRKRRGMTQEVLCGLVGGRSIEWLRQIENGHRDVDKLSTIVAVAEALRISPNALLPGPFRATSRHAGALGSAPDVVPAIEAAMLRYDGIAGLVGVPDRPPVVLPNCIDVPPRAAGPRELGRRLRRLRFRGVGGQPDGRGELRELRRLELDRPERDPAAGAVHALPFASRPVRPAPGLVCSQARRRLL